MSCQGSWAAAAEVWAPLSPVDWAGGEGAADGGEGGLQLQVPPLRWRHPLQHSVDPAGPAAPARLCSAVQLTPVPPGTAHHHVIVTAEHLPPPPAAVGSPRLRTHCRTSVVGMEIQGVLYGREFFMRLSRPLWPRQAQRGFVR